MPPGGSTTAAELVGYFRHVEPPHKYVREMSSSVVHHQDYLNRHDDQALCGVAFEDPTPLDAISRPDEVCPECEAKLVEYHLTWWRATAESATAELDELRIKYQELSLSVGDDDRQVADVRHPAEAEPVSEDGDATLPPLLTRARTELLQLCRQFDETIPYFRLKRSMDAFSDTLESNERILLAEEIGGDGSLMRWCTKQIKGLGRQISNNPVNSDTDAMQDAWNDLYGEHLNPTPKKPAKWRMGRSR